VLTDEARFALFRRKLLDHVEGIVAASVKPMEKIKDIRIMQLNGMNGAGGDGGSGKNATDEVIDSALRYRVQAPLVDSLLSDIGIDGSNLSKMGGLVREARDLTSIAKDAARSSGKGESGTGGGSDASGGETPDAQTSDTATATAPGPDDSGGSTPSPAPSGGRRRRSSKT